MKILMVTNTYAPHVGGVARSVESFTHQFRELGHRVQIVCPTFEGVESTRQVIRVPAIEHFRGSSFSFPLPFPSGVHHAIDEFAPDIVHSHHPFLLGDAALRIGAERGIPVVFTHHTQYDKYTHHLGAGESHLAKVFINDLDVGYCNLCDTIVAPSETVRQDLQRRKVTTPIEVIPTGIDEAWWKVGSTVSAREAMGVPQDAIVVGHVGRLATEKNLPFLATAVAEFLNVNPTAWFIVAGTGKWEAGLKDAMASAGVADRVITWGILDPVQLRNVYHSMDVFAFASTSETQGIVLAEALACGVPVVAIEGPGVREVIRDEINGRMLTQPTPSEFVAALQWVVDQPDLSRSNLRREAEASAAAYSIEKSAEAMLKLYEWTRQVFSVTDPEELHEWRTQVNRVETEASIWGNIATALGDSITSTLVGNKIF